MKILMLTSLFIANVCFCQNTINITDKEIYNYWDIDNAKMNQMKFPIKMGDIIKKHGGSIQFKYTFLIDIDGRPKNFVFISAEPKSAEAEKNNLRKLVLFRRYKHKENSGFTGTTFVEADLRWWEPDPKTISFPSAK